MIPTKLTAAQINRMWYNNRVELSIKAVYPAQEFSVHKNPEGETVLIPQPKATFFDVEYTHNGKFVCEFEFKVVEYYKAIEVGEEYKYQFQAMPNAHIGIVDEWVQIMANMSKFYHTEVLVMCVEKHYREMVINLIKQLNQHNNDKTLDSLQDEPRNGGV